MKLFEIFRRKKETPVLPVEEQLRLKGLIQQCDIALIEDEFNAKNIDISIDSLTPLQLAIYDNCEVLINHFIELGADVNKPFPDGNSPLIVACSEGRVETVELLLKNQANPFYINNSNTSAIWYATTDVNPKLVSLLLTYKADPFMDTGNGMSSYDLAKTMKLNEIVEIMENFRK